MPGRNFHQIPQEGDLHTCSPTRRTQHRDRCCLSPTTICPQGRGRGSFRSQMNVDQGQNPQRHSFPTCCVPQFVFPGATSQCCALLSPSRLCALKHFPATCCVPDPERPFSKPFCAPVHGCIFPFRLQARSTSDCIARAPDRVLSAW